MQDPDKETYAPGDVLNKTPFYESNYPSWTVMQATVVSAKKSIVKDTPSNPLGKDERALYHARYGVRKEFPLFALMVEAEGHTYLVSQLGFNKDPPQTINV